MLNDSHEIQREQKAELIFHGEEIAKAIRAYKDSIRNYPLNLEGLLSDWLFVVLDEKEMSELLSIN